MDGRHHRRALWEKSPNLSLNLSPNATAPRSVFFLGVLPCILRRYRHQLVGLFFRLHP